MKLQFGAWADGLFGNQLLWSTSAGLFSCQQANSCFFYPCEHAGIKNRCWTRGARASKKTAAFQIWHTDYSVCFSTTFKLEVTDLVRLLTVHRMQVQRERERLSFRELRTEQTLAVTGLRTCGAGKKPSIITGEGLTEEVGNYFSEALLDKTADPLLW